MHPILLDLPALGLRVPSSRAFPLLAAIVCLTLGPFLVQRWTRVEAWRARRVMMLIALCAFVGGYLHFLLSQWSTRTGATPLFGLASLHAPGAIVGVALSAPLLLRYFHLPVAATVDALVPVVGMGIAIARLGCFLQGCCFGLPCNAPWCVTFPSGGYIHAHHQKLGLIDAAAVRSAAIHPLQLYFAAAGLLIALLAVALHPRRRYDGQIALFGLTAFSATATVLEPLRADYYPRVYWGPLPQLQWTTLAMTIAVALLWGLIEIAQRRKSPSLHGSLHSPHSR